ncbi:hypothetical protein STEG23_031783 [Scotinomys teguina]
MNESDAENGTPGLALVKHMLHRVFVHPPQLCELRTELRALRLLGKRSTTELNPQSRDWKVWLVWNRISVRIVSEVDPGKTQKKTTAGLCQDKVAITKAKVDFSSVVCLPPSVIAVKGLDGGGAGENDDEPVLLSLSAAPSPQSEAVANELQELSLQPELTLGLHPGRNPNLPPLSERKNDEETSANSLITGKVHLEGKVEESKLEERPVRGSVVRMLAVKSRDPR